MMHKRNLMEKYDEEQGGQPYPLGKFCCTMEGILGRMTIYEAGKHLLEMGR